jgi:hypothetical protein
MSLSTQTNRTDHTENGVTTVFPFDFKIFSEADLVVLSVDQFTDVETQLTLGVDYTVSGVNADAGSITKTAGTSGDGLVIKRIVPLNQPTVLRNQSDFFPATHEKAFDRIVMQIQQVWATAVEAATTVSDYIVAGVENVYEWYSRIGKDSLWQYMSATEKAQYLIGANPDLTVALQTAIDNAPIGSTLVLPAGNFKTSATIYMGKGIRILGTGHNGDETTFALHSQWTIPDTGIAFQWDNYYVHTGGINSKDPNSAGSMGAILENIKFQGLLPGGIPALLTADQIAINTRGGWALNIRDCDFRNVGTCIAGNGAWSHRVVNNRFLSVGYCYRNDPDFALAGHYYEIGSGLNLYQVNGVELTANMITAAGYGFYFYGPNHNISIHDNTVQGCTQIGIMCARYNGALSTTGTDLGNRFDMITVKNNYFENNAISEQYGKLGTGSVALSAPTAVESRNFYTFQGVLQGPCLYLVGAVDLDWHAEGVEPYLTPTTTHEVVLYASCYTLRCKITAKNGWDGDFNGDTTSSIRKLDNSYRSWTPVYVDGSSVTKITAAHVHAQDAGISSKPFDSIATLNLWIQRVLRVEKNQANLPVPALTVYVSDGAYAEALTFDQSYGVVSEYDVVPNGSASADGISFTGLQVNGPYTVRLSSSGKFVLDVDPAAATPNRVSLGGLAKLDTLKLKYASAGGAGSNGFYATDGGTISLVGVTHFDANKPQTGMNAYASTIMIDSTSVISGSSASRSQVKGGMVWDEGGTYFTYTSIFSAQYNYMNHVSAQFEFGNGAGTPSWKFRGVVNTIRGFYWQTGSSNRAFVGLGAGAEGGSDAGSPQVFSVYNDAGTKEDWLTVPRGAGLPALSTKAIRFPAPTVAALPAAATYPYARCFVTDSTVTLTAGIGATVVGGGANKVPVWSDGTNWKIG